MPIRKEPTDRGVLTEKQREFLRETEKERLENYSAQERYRRQKYIRAQLANALSDLRLLFQHLPDDELKKIFSTDIDIHEGPEGEAKRTVGESAVGYLPYMVSLLARVSDKDNGQIFAGLSGREQPAMGELILTIERGIETWLVQEKRMSADVGVDVKLENMRPVEEIVEDSGPISPSEHRRLLRGDLEPETLVALKERIEAELEDIGGEELVDVDEE